MYVFIQLSNTCNKVHVSIFPATGFGSKIEPSSGRYTRTFLP